MSLPLDRRLHAFRPDLADERLIGCVAATRFVAGRPARVGAPVVDLRPQPDWARGIDTQALWGEALTIFDEQDGWAWVQLSQDGYVGYVPSDAILSNDDGTIAPTHRITALRSFVYEAPDLKRPVSRALSMGSRLTIVEIVEHRGTGYGLLDDGRAVIAGHLAPIDGRHETDYVDLAARLVETPYLWGGRSAFGIDCSGLVQLCMMMTGRNAPRDSDMQADTLGRPIERDALQRGDLVFWKGHVAIMEDPVTLLHANGRTMTVAREGFEDAVARIAALYGPPTGFRRP
jgi:cell wall-associated NlpC family hydrolase